MVLRYRIPETVKYQSQERTFPCPLGSCSALKETQKALLVHLLIVHYKADMDSRYGADFKLNPKKCPVCSAVLLQVLNCRAL